MLKKCFNTKFESYSKISTSLSIGGLFTHETSASAAGINGYMDGISNEYGYNIWNKHMTYSSPIQILLFRFVSICINDKIGHLAETRCVRLKSFLGFHFMYSRDCMLSVKLVDRIARSQNVNHISI